MKWAGKNVALSCCGLWDAGAAEGATYPLRPLQQLQSHCRWHLKGHTRGDPVALSAVRVLPPVDQTLLVK